MKRTLPPAASFRLRTLKSSLLDHELRELLSFAKLVGGADAVAIDVGANWGIYSAALAPSFKRVVAIEPNPDCVAYMRRVMPANCTVVASAVSDHARRAALRVPVVGRVRETPRATISPVNEFDGLQTTATVEIEVDVAPLDALLRRAIRDGALSASDHPSLLKIDVEGHEFPVLSGAGDLLRSVGPSLCIELERRHGTQTDETLDLLRDLGYRAVRLCDGRLVFDDDPPKGTPRSKNVLFVSKRHRQRF